MSAAGVREAVGSTELCLGRGVQGTAALRAGVAPPQATTVGWEWAIMRGRKEGKGGRSHGLKFSD